MKSAFNLIKFLFRSIADFGGFMLGIFSLLFIIALIIVSGSQVEPFQIEDGSVLVLAPQGVIVEQAALPDPLQNIVPRSRPLSKRETSIHDITEVLGRATNDSRISAIALYMDKFSGAAQAHLHRIADGLKAFRETGRPVYAISSGYRQSAYLLAAEADEIFINPAGLVEVTGLGFERIYFSELLEKLDASVNVFRVGSYKSAVEPFLRKDMSPEAREANLKFLNALWDAYADRVAQARGIDRASFDAMLENTPDALRAVDGDFAEFALAQNLVDRIEPQQTWRSELMERFGADKDGSSFKQIYWRNYLAATKQKKHHKKTIAVITAQGTIVSGEGPISVSAADTLIRYIRDARNRSDVAAIVLRVNSPGGSAFASEMIRQELAAAQADGIPVIASFAAVAASGGYWIAASSDEIWANPTTLTGSIGIFGIVPTFENTIAKVGIHTDSVGTTPLAEPLTLLRPLSEPAKDIFQQSVEAGYRDFLTLVAENRGMTMEEADTVAQGRVWDGQTALDLGLVDQLGDIDAALNSAATRAGLEDYAVDFYRDELSPFDRFLLDITNSQLAASFLGKGARVAEPQIPAVLSRGLEAITSDVEILGQFNDPQGRYALCLLCSTTK